MCGRGQEPGEGGKEEEEENSCVPSLLSYMYMYM